MLQSLSRAGLFGAGDWAPPVDDRSRIERARDAMPAEDYDELVQRALALAVEADA